MSIASRLVLALLLALAPAAALGASNEAAPNNAALRASPTTQFSGGLWRSTFGNGNGAPPLFYLPGTGACGIAAGAGDDGSQVKSADNKCWLAAFPASGADAREWGVKFDGNTATDNTTTLQAALNWFALGNTLLLPAALAAYHASPLAVTLASNAVSASITGPGRDQAILGYTGGSSSTALTITYANSALARNSVHLFGWTYCTTQAGLATGITLTQNANVGTGSLPFNDFNLTLRGCDGYAQTDYWASGLLATGVFGIDFKGLLVQGPSSAGTVGTGVHIKNGGSAIVGQFNFPGVTFGNVLNAILVDADIQGVTITGGSNFTYVGHGFISTSGVGTDQITISDSQFNCTNICVQSPFADVFIHDNYFIISANGIPAIDLGGSNGATIRGNVFRNGSSFINTAALRVDSAPPLAHEGITVTGNQAIGISQTLVMLNAVNLPVNASGNNWGGAAPNLVAGAKTNWDQPLPFADVIAPATGIQQSQAFTDSNTTTWGAPISGGGGSAVLGFNNGTAWTVAGK